MPINSPVNLVLLLVLIYGLMGALFSVAFVLVGAKSIDVVVRGTPLRTRLLFAPGAIALWPLLLIKWRRAGGHS